jgi:DNA repair protein RecN (Recombination protein N)
MLRKLTVNDYTVLSQAEIDFQPGMNVITGETGVGKSLLLDAVGSLMGERRTSFPIRAGQSKSVIEAEFDSPPGGLITAWLEVHELPSEIPVIVRREFHTTENSTSNRTRIFINDVPTNLGTAKELGSLLIDLHGQHETVALFERVKQLDFLDAFSGKPAVLKRYRECFDLVRALRQKHAELTALLEDSSAGTEVLRKQARELSDLDPKPGEIESIEMELERLENSEKIFELCSELCDTLNEAPGSSVELLSNVSKLLPSLFPYYPSLETWTKDLEGVRSALVELNRTLQEISRSISHDPQVVEELRLRLAALTGYQKRWNCAGRDLTDHAVEIQQRLAGMDDLATQSENVGREIAGKQVELIDAGMALSEHRKGAAVKLVELVQHRLALIGMEKARFKVSFKVLRTEQPLENGLDELDFELSPNQKVPFQPLKKVASGGEMSRILLALKSSLAAADRVETLIFDEVDQGISGRIAHMVGLQLLELARSHQVIVVTHLPQIACLGDLHLSVRSGEGDSTAVVEELSGEERVNEVAALLAATGISDGALMNAREMLDSGQALRNQ